MIARRQIGSLRSVVAIKELAPGPVNLGVHASASEYLLTFATGEGAPQTLATGETRYLSTEVAGGFTGVYLAMYASGREFAAAASLIFIAHVPVVVIEGLVTGSIVVFLKRVRPEMFALEF